MQPRLTRSNTDVTLFGVCGGLGEYFNIDPVIVRVIFVLLTLTSGIGIPAYLILLLIMPKGGPAPAPPDPSFQQGAQQSGDHAHHFGQQLGQEISRIGQQLGQEAEKIGREAREVLIAQRRAHGQQRVAPGQPSQPLPFLFDPITGQPIPPESAATGETVNLRIETPELPAQAPPPIPQIPPAAVPPRRARNWNTLGFILIGIGGLILLEKFGVNMSLVFPILLIVAGFILLSRQIR